METYPFDVIDPSHHRPLADPSVLALRPCVTYARSFEEDAERYSPDEDLTTSMNTAIAIGQPLLLTGEPGTGKTQAAYYAAHRLGLGEVLHFQVKSDSTATDLLYEFDTVRYFHDAAVRDGKPLRDKAGFIDQRTLWEAFESDMPRVVLIDEIDKAPRDFPNDLLLELDRMMFRVKETGQLVRAEHRPIVFITSNQERRLPKPFLRRCCYHNIRFTEDLARQAIAAHRDDFAHFSDGFIELARERFFELREERKVENRHMPTTGEMLVWLRALAHRYDTDPRALLEAADEKLPFSSLLDKNDPPEAWSA